MNNKSLVMRLWDESLQGVSLRKWDKQKSQWSHNKASEVLDGCFPIYDMDGRKRRVSRDEFDFFVWWISSECDAAKEGKKGILRLCDTGVPEEWSFYCYQVEKI